MKNDIEKRIIAAQPPDRGRSEFVARTMLAVKQVKTRETFSHVLRRTHMSKKDSLLMKLKHLPGTMVAVLVIVAVLLLSGTAYAAYRAWLRPETNIKSVEQKYGRDQVFVDLKNCYSQGERVQIEINQGRTGNPAEAAAVQGARCEINAIQNWAVTELGVDVSNVMFPHTISARTKDRISLKYESEATRNFELSDDLILIAGGDIAEINIFQEGDPVAFIVSRDDNRKLLAIVKLSYPAQLYDSADTQNTYHIRYECNGNPASSCIDLPSLDVLRDGEGGANPETRGEARVIQGKLVSYTDTRFELQSTSGETYTVHTATNVIGIFNAGNPYGAITIEKDDVLEVRYSQASDDDSKEIGSSQYHSIQLLLQEFDKKSDRNLQKYRY